MLAFGAGDLGSNPGRTAIHILMPDSCCRGVAEPLDSIELRFVVEAAPLHHGVEDRLVELVEPPELHHHRYGQQDGLVDDVELGTVDPAAHVEHGDGDGVPVEDLGLVGFEASGLIERDHADGLEPLPVDATDAHDVAALQPSEEDDLLAVRDVPIDREAAAPDAGCERLGIRLRGSGFGAVDNDHDDHD